MKKRILTEAAGSPVSHYMIRAIQNAGHIAVASDVTSDCAAKVYADDFLIVPKANDLELWEKLEDILIQSKIDVVIPSFDETLLSWAKHKEHFKALGINVLISPIETIEVFQDKWATALFFERQGLPCAKSSLEPIYPLVKPRAGRGSEGVFIEEDDCKRAELFQDGDISQSILTGVEYTVDCLFNNKGQPIYIIPRKRMNVTGGKSTGGVTEENHLINALVRQLAKSIIFVGPVNVQVFVDGDTVNLVEVNPRIAGGMALGFESSENWVNLFIDLFSDKDISPVEVNWGLKMFRCYQEFYT